MNANEPITGSIEITTADDESLGIPGRRWTLDTVPVVLETLRGITNLEDAEPQQQSSGRTPLAQWTARDANNQDVTVLLWEDTPYEETAIAQAIAAAIAEGGTA